MYIKLTLILLILNALHAEAISPKDNECFQLPLTAGLNVNATAQATPYSPSTIPANAPRSNVNLKLDSDGIWKDFAAAIFKKEISDHSLEGHMIDGDIPVYTWNTCGYQSRGGFSSGGSSRNQTQENADEFIIVQPQ
jgi:hypothetical protein